MDLTQILRAMKPEYRARLTQALSFPCSLGTGLITLKPVTTFLSNRVLATLRALEADVDAVRTFSASSYTDMEALELFVNDVACIPARNLEAALVRAYKRKVHRSHTPLSVEEYDMRLVNSDNATLSNGPLVARNPSLFEAILHATRNPPFDVCIPVDQQVIASVVDDALWTLIHEIVLRCAHNENIDAHVAMLNLYADVLVVGIDDATVLVVTA